MSDATTRANIIVGRTCIINGWETREDRPTDLNFIGAMVAEAVNNVVYFEKRVAVRNSFINTAIDQAWQGVEKQLSHYTLPNQLNQTHI